MPALNEHFAGRLLGTAWNCVEVLVPVGRRVRTVVPTDDERLILPRSAAPRVFATAYKQLLSLAENWILCTSQYLHLAPRHRWRRANNKNKGINPGAPPPAVRVAVRLERRAKTARPAHFGPRRRKSSDNGPNRLGQTLRA
jgi:hypothetical protein